MNILYASTHGALTAEIAILCNRTKNKMFLLTKECSLITAGHPAGECSFFEELGIEGIVSNEGLLDKIKEIDFVLVSTPEQVKKARDIVKCPLGIVAAIPGGMADEFNKLGVNNFMSPSSRHLSLLNCSNKLLYPRLIWKEKFPGAVLVEEKSGFYSYVHWMRKYWPKSAAKLDRLNLISSVTVKNFGFESPYGVVDDLAYMRKAKATVHIKDKGLTCTAPVRSLAVGTAVIMDEETYCNGFFDSVRGMTVVKTIEDVAREIERLETDIDYLEEKSTEALENAASQFGYRKEHGDAFAEFLMKVT